MITYLLLYLFACGGLYVLFLWYYKKIEGYVTIKDALEIFFYAYIPLLNVALIFVLTYEVLKIKGFLDKKIL